MKSKLIKLLSALAIIGTFSGCSNETPQTNNTINPPPISPSDVAQAEHPKLQEEAPRVTPKEPDNEQKAREEEATKNYNANKQQTEPPKVQETPKENTNKNPPAITKEQKVRETNLKTVEQEIYKKVNAERSNAGLSPLSYNNTMEKYARIKSNDMGDRGYFAHEDPEGKLITSQMDNDGVVYNAWGENIGYSTGEINQIASDMMTMWMNSQGHRENILSKDFTSIGIGVTKHGNKIYATQEFLNP